MREALACAAGIPVRYRRVTAAGSYVPQIDGLRFLAIMPVLFWHAGIRAVRMVPGADYYTALAWLPHGYVGVELFFFISGYIISFPFLAGRPPSLGRFYLRRVYRLEPPYLIAMVGAFLALTLSGYRPTDALSFRGDIPLWQSLAASLVYLHGIIFGVPSTLNPPAWSLEVEIQFYLLSPFLLLAYLRAPSRRARMAMATALAIAFVLLSCWLDTTYGRYGFHRLSLVGHAPAFILGVVMSDYALAERPFQAPAKARFDAGMLGGAVLLLGAGLYEWRHDFATGVVRDMAKLAGMVLLYFGAARGLRGRRWLGAAPIALIGGMCYSIYLVHLIVMQAASVVLAQLGPMPGMPAAFLVAFGVLVPLGIAAGFIFYVAVERPCMQPDWPQRLARALRGRNGAPAASRQADGR